MRLVGDGSFFGTHAYDETGKEMCDVASLEGDSWAITLGTSITVPRYGEDIAMLRTYRRNARGLIEVDWATDTVVTQRVAVIVSFALDTSHPE